MSKLKCFPITLVLIISLLSFTAFGKEYPAYNSDISSYINISEIPSVNIYGETYVLLEKLNDYGFDVVWNEQERTLSVSFNQYVNPEIPAQAKSDGSLDFVAKPTDIKAIVNGQEMPCYWSEKGIITKFDNLYPFGEIRWNGELRKIRLLTGVYTNYVNFPDDVLPFYEEFPEVPSFERTGAPKYTEKYGDERFSSVTYVYKRADITQQQYEAYINLLVQSGFKYKGSMYYDSNVWLERGDTPVVIGVDNNYLYVKVYY